MTTFLSLKNILLAISLFVVFCSCQEDFYSCLQTSCSDQDYSCFWDKECAKYLECFVGCQDDQKLCDKQCRPLIDSENNSLYGDLTKCLATHCKQSKKTN